MPGLSHEQYDEKVMGLAATYEALSGLDLMPEALTGGEVDNSVIYGYYGKIYETDTFHHDLTRGVRAGLDKLKFDVGCWGRFAHDSSTFIDEADEDKRLEMSGILAMMTAPRDQEQFDSLALQIFELFDKVTKGEPVVVERPGKKRFIDGDWRPDVQQVGEHNGKLQVIFDNGHVADRAISIWSDRPERIHSEEPNARGGHPQVVFPLLVVDLEALALGAVRISYPDHLPQATEPEAQPVS